MIDTHAHINTEAFDEDRSEVIKNAKQAGVESIIIPAIEPKFFESVLQVCNDNDGIYCGIGIHPHNANDFNDKNLNIIAELTKEDKVVAVGETGLDYYYDFAPKKVQHENFRQHLKLARELSLPIIIHNRESDKDLLDIIKEEQNGNIRGVLHCFSSGIYEMEKALDLNMHLSFTGNVTFKKSNHAEVIEKVPEDRFMIETDSPYMAPVPHRGKRNEPKFVRFVAEKIAEIKSLKFDEVINMTSITAKELFKISTLAFLFSILSMNYLISQNDDFDLYEDDYEEYEYDDEIEEENFYKKGIGIGFLIGPNTVVENQTLVGLGVERSVSYDGILAYGGTITYGGLFDFLVLSGSYVYSINEDIQVESEGVLDPTVYQMFEFATHWIPNPYNRVNFFLTGGFGMINEEFYTFEETPEAPQGEVLQNIEWTQAIIGGLGFYFNIVFENVGMMSIAAEWRLNFELGTKNLPSDPTIPPDQQVNFQPVDLTRFYSIPRVSLIFYPDF